MSDTFNNQEDWSLFNFFSSEKWEEIQAIVAILEFLSQNFVYLDDEELTVHFIDKNMELRHTRWPTKVLAEMDYYSKIQLFDDMFIEYARDYYHEHLKKT